MNKLLQLFFLSLAIICYLGKADAAKLQSVDVEDSAGKTAVVFSVTGPFAYKLFTLSKPERVVVDFEQTGFSIDANKLAKGNGLISNIRIGYPHAGAQTMRVVLDMNQSVRITEIPAARQLRLEFIGQSKAFTPVTANVLNQQKPAVPSKPMVKLSYNPKSAKKTFVIVLDPGHGGKDPGAIGSRRSAEKNVTLQIAKKLQQIINKQPGMKAVLTRTGDYYVGLRERMHIARKQEADLFISIHADAFINRNSSGASVFALSQNGATSEAARWLAEKENYSELGGVDLAGLDDQTGLVRSVLIDLSQTATISQSLDMGSRILSALDNITNLHNNKVEQARFMVLKSPDIPSVLIETGFISNPREEKNLTSPSYQARLTQAIFEGLRVYFARHPGSSKSELAYGK